MKQTPSHMIGLAAVHPLAVGRRRRRTGNRFTPALWPDPPPGGIRFAPPEARAGSGLPAADREARIALYAGRAARREPLFRAGVPA